MSEHTHGRLKFKTEEAALVKKNKKADREINQLKTLIKARRENEQTRSRIKRLKEMNKAAKGIHSA